MENPQEHHAETPLETQPVEQTTEIEAEEMEEDEIEEEATEEEQERKNKPSEEEVARFLQLPDRIQRCQHRKISGYLCGAPALKGRRLCYWHFQAYKNRARLRAHQFGEGKLKLPILEDARSIQFALTHVVELLANGRIDTKTAGTMVYAIQCASTILRSPDLMEARENQGDARCLSEALLIYLGLPVQKFREAMAEADGRKLDNDDLSFDEQEEENEAWLLGPAEPPPIQ